MLSSARVVGTHELVQVSIEVLHLQGRFFDMIARIDFGILGYAIVGLFLAASAPGLG